MTHISTLRLHQLRLGELSGEESSRLREHLDACALCAGRLGHQEATRAAFVRVPVPAAITPAPTFWERVRDLRLLFLLLPVAAAAFVFVRATPDSVEAIPTEHLKGQAPLLEAWVQTGKSARPLYTNERVREGTRVQLKYDAGRHRFVTFAGRDGKGVVEVYSTLAAEGPGIKNAPFALTLDGTGGEQAFFAILTDTRPAPDDVLAALSQEPIRMERGEIASLVLRKE